MSYRHLDGPVFRIGFETYLVYKSMALQLQRANSRMSWNAAVRESYAALAPDDRKAVDQILSGTGCQPLGEKV